MPKRDRDFAEMMNRRLEASSAPRGAARIAIRSIVSWDDPINRPIEVYIARFKLRVEQESASLQENRRRNSQRYSLND